MIIKEQRENMDRTLMKLQNESDESEWHMHHQDHVEIVELVIPRFFRSPFVVMLWAAYESAVIQISNLLREKKGTALSIRDLRADNFIEQAQKYFQHVLYFPILTDKKSRDRLEMLRILRNAIAHSNGRVEAIKNEKDRKKIRDWAKKDLGISTIDGNLIFSKKFLNESFKIVNESITELIERAEPLVNY